jgi:hypothetical protein
VDARLAQEAVVTAEELEEPFTGLRLSRRVMSAFIPETEIYARTHDRRT